MDGWIWGVGTFAILVGFIIIYLIFERRTEVTVTMTVDSELLYEFIDDRAGETMQNDTRVGLYVGGIVKDLVRARELDDRLRTLPLTESERLVDMVRKDELDRSLAQRASLVWGYHQG